MGALESLRHCLLLLRGWLQSPGGIEKAVSCKLCFGSGDKDDDMETEQGEVVEGQ